MDDKGFVEHGLASIIAAYCTHPLDLIKVRMQLQGEASAPINPAPRMGSVSVGVKIVQKQGVAALFSGVSATVLKQCLFNTTRMGVFNIIVRKWSDPNTDNAPLMACAAIFGTAIGAAIGTPAEMAMVRMQADGRLPLADRRNYKSVVDAISQMSKTEGVTSLWRGSSLTMTRCTLFSLSLVSYVPFKEMILEKGLMKDGLGTLTTASFAAAFVAAATTNPLDVIKTRVMNMKVEPGTVPAYNGAFDCAMKTIKAEGLRALYKGFIPTVVWEGSFLVVFLVTLEQVHKLIGLGPSVTFSLSSSLDK